MSNTKIETMIAAVTRGELSRRDFMARAGQLGIGAGMANGLLTLGASSARAAVKRGGRIRVATQTGGTADSLDPTKFLSTVDYLRAYLMYTPLTALDRKSRAIPALAESWESDDAVNWAFHLRKDVEWSDGAKTTAKDVVYSLQRHLAEKSESPGKPMLEQVIEMKADGDHVVRMKLAAANADLPTLFTTPQFMITRDGQDDFTAPISNGPFTLKSFKAGVQAVLDRNDNYWGTPAPADRMEVTSVGDTTARMNALMAGKFDVVTGVDHKILDLLKKAPGVDVVSSPSSQHANFAMMVDRAPTDNNDLRLALKYISPREKFVKNVFKGYAQVGNDHQVAPTDPFYCDEIPQRHYDPDKAKFHLKKAGMAGGSIDLYSSFQATSGADAIALLYKEAARPAGLEVNVTMVPPDSYWTTAWMQKAFVVSGWNARPTADLMLSIANKSDGSWNESQWKNKHFDDLLVAARGEIDFAKRKAMYCEMQKMLQEDGGTSVIAFYDEINAKRSNVAGMEPHPAGLARNAFFGVEVGLKA